MKMSVHFRFGWYVFCTTVTLAGVVYFWNRDPRLLVPFYVFFPYLRKVLGPGYKGWHESNREVSNLALVIGFIICLAVVWVGGLTIAHYISPMNHPPKYIVWLGVALIWGLLVYPAYQWWRAQKTEPTAC